MPDMMVLIFWKLFY